MEPFGGAFLPQYSSSWLQLSSKSLSDSVRSSDLGTEVDPQEKKSPMPEKRKSKCVNVIHKFEALPKPSKNQMTMKIT